MRRGRSGEIDDALVAMELTTLEQRNEQRMTVMTRGPRHDR